MASPWGKIDKVETTNFQDIMSEEYARGLQNKENKKLTEYLRMGLEDRSSQSKEKPGSSKSAEKDDDGEQYQSEKKDTTPEDVMKIIQEDPMLGAGTILTEYCDSDELIAHVLQAQFDSEYNEELKRLEKSKNKQSKISVSFKNYERHGDNDLEDEDDYDDEHLYDNMKGDWDRFETNEKKIDSIPKCGFKVDEEVSKKALFSSSYKIWFQKAKEGIGLLIRDLVKFSRAAWLPNTTHNCAEFGTHAV